MSDFSRRCKKNANPIKWRKSEGWVGNRRTQFPSLTSFTLSTEKQENQNKAESDVKCCILILDGQKVVKIKVKYMLMQFNYNGQMHISYKLIVCYVIISTFVFL